MNSRVIVREPAVETVVLADIDESRLRQVAAKLPPGRAETLVLDASERGPGEGREECRLRAQRLGHGLGPPAHGGLPGGRAALPRHGRRRAARHHGRGDLDEQLALDHEFDTVESLTVLDGDKGTVDGDELATWRR